MATGQDIERIAALPGVERARAAARRTGVPTYLVGGAVRDALLGADRADLDLVVEGDPLELAAALGDVVRIHDRFGTAEVETADGRIDVARARAERYERPGALPVVSAGSVDEDLGRRDFSINAIACRLDRGPPQLIDPYQGEEDLRDAVLRALHPDSLADDPTRAVRAARYATRLGLQPETATEKQLRAADLSTLSSDRLEAELRKLGEEANPVGALRLLSDWGLISVDPAAFGLISAAAELLKADPWVGTSTVPEIVADVVMRDGEARARELAEHEPDSPWSGIEAVRGRSERELVLGRAAGGRWLDDYMANWRGVRLQIGGEDLLAEGVPHGPAVGLGLAAALRAKLDGEAPTREDELRIALRAARS